MSVKILVADDDADNLAIAVVSLESAGFQVLTATNGLEAVDSAEKNNPDIIFMDLSMPKLDGWKAVEKIRQTPAIAKIPVIAFTAHAMVGDEAKARKAGVDDYISKPCRPADLVQKAKQWIR